MIELITGISILASSVTVHLSATGVIASSTASTTEDTASTTAQVQTLDQTQADRLNNYKIEVQKYYQDNPTLIAIAKCESDFRQYDKNGELIRGKVNPADVGIMQINEKYHLEKSKSLGYNIYTVEGNLAYAKYMYDQQGAAPWSASEKCWSKSIESTDSIAMK